MVPASITTALLANVWTDTQVRHAMTDMFKKFSCHYFLILFPGEYCEIDASVCNETICKNFGECIEGPGFSFYCRCREGKKFVILLTCVKNILLLCIFYSIIMVLFSSHIRFSLLLRKGWTGVLCEVDVDECLKSPCRNGGLCINIPSSYTCACLFGKQIILAHELADFLSKNSICEVIIKIWVNN